MNAQDLEIFNQLAGAAWLLGVFITLFLGTLAVLLPFFVWRIWKWSHATCQEVTKLNSKIDRLVALMEQRGAVAPAPLNPEAPEEEKAPPAPQEEMFPFATAEEEETPPAAPEEEVPVPEGPEGVAFEFEPFAAEEEAAPEEERTVPAAAEEEELTPAAPAAAEEEPFAPAPPAAEKPGITKMEDDPGKPEASFARCEICGHKLAYKKTMAGKKVRCPSCKTVHTLP